jgi:hypothetical protein
MAATCSAGAIDSEELIMQPVISPNPRARASRASASASVSPPDLSSLTFTWL